jgi:sugar/nucleoside kinase (ribokinase family)
MKIVLIGHVCIDSNDSEHSKYTSWGGPLMYMSNYLDKYHGVKPVLIAPYGSDFLIYTKDVSLIPGPTRPHTLVYKNISHQGVTTRQCHHADIAYPVRLSPTIKSHIATADIICVAPLLPNYPTDYVRRLLSLRKPTSLSVLHPQGYFRQTDSEGKISQRDFTDAEKIIPFFDLVIFSEDDHSDALTIAAKWGKVKAGSFPIVTQGPRGASWIDSEGRTHEIWTHSVPESQIIDSVGCGDTFIASSMYDYFVNRDIESAIKAGNKAAGAKLFRVGV